MADARTATSSRLQRQIEATDRQVDRLVYGLDDPSDRCDLTEEEVAIVEGGGRIGTCDMIPTAIIAGRSAFVASLSLWGQAPVPALMSGRQDALGASTRNACSRKAYQALTRRVLDGKKTTSWGATKN